MSSVVPVGTLPQRPLGSTGVDVSCIGMGGFHIGKQDDARESIRLVHAGIDAGINFMDNSWDYNGGESELRMGKALAENHARDRVFLMTKIDGRDGPTATQQLEESMRRLRVGHLDLVQIHEVIRPNDPDRSFAPGAVLDVLKRAREAGTIRFIGFTGHKSPHIHLAMIERADAHGFTFDTVQMPLNVMDAHYESFERLVVPEAKKRGMGVIGMKPFGDHYILKSRRVAPVDALHYSLDLPLDVLVTGIDSLEVLEQNVAAARSFAPLSRERRAAILAETAFAARRGSWEHYKSTNEFDSTHEQPEYLGPDGEAGVPARVM